MSFLRVLANSLSLLLFSTPVAAPMDASAAAVVGERVDVKLRGYFELAKEEIDKAMRAEEWGLPDDAEAHYRNALHIMIEAMAACVPDAFSPSERGQVRVYRDKIAKWQTRVEERLRELGRRSGAAAPVPKTGHNAAAGRQASTHGFMNSLGCVLGRRGWTRTTATRVPSSTPRNMMLSCITLMPMKGEILVGTMDKTLKTGVFLKSGLIEREGPFESIKGHL